MKTNASLVLLCCLLWTIGHAQILHFRGPCLPYLAATASPVGSGGATAKIDSVPNEPGPIVGVNLTCAGRSETYLIDTVAGATSYAWTLPAGWSGSSTSSSITVTVGAGSGTIGVTANNASGASPASTLYVEVRNVPFAPAPISGPTNVCEGSQQTYSTSLSGSFEWPSWSLPSGWLGGGSSSTIATTAGAAGGTISVTAHNTCGASAPTTMGVTVHPHPLAAFSYSTTYLSATFADSSQGATAWHWDFGDGNSSTQQNPSHTYFTAGTFQVCLIATGPGCSDTSCLWLNVVALGLEELDAFPVEISPNPSTGQFQVMTGAKVIGQLVDGSGRLLASYNWSRGMHSVDLSDLPQGIYFLHLVGSQGKVSLKLLRL